jgi:hypothetical protein
MACPLPNRTSKVGLSGCGNSTCLQMECRSDDNRVELPFDSCGCCKPPPLEHVTGMCARLDGFGNSGVLHVGAGRLMCRPLLVQIDC